MNDVNSEPDILAGDADPKKWLDWTTTQQSRASHPEHSAWVSANAGSGKTHVLTQRVIRLLLAGARPSSILCLTYTKAAASEMSNRVFERLAEWVTLDDEALASRLSAIEQKQPDRATLAKARQLFAKALETPGGLKIQTIHAFCEALLHQFPLEANVAGHFSVLDDRAASSLLAEARRSLLTATSSEGDAQLAEAFAHVLSTADETGLEGLLADVVSNRHALRHFEQSAALNGGVDTNLRRALGIGPSETELSRALDFWPLPGLTSEVLPVYLDLALQKGGEKVRDSAEALERAFLEREPLTRALLTERAFLTKSETPKADSSLVSAAMAKVAPQLKDALAIARDHVMLMRDRLRIYRMYQATAAALTLASRLDRDYEDLKKRRSQLDFEDLIVRTSDLLKRGDVGPWVHYKLDQGIDHILVDEAQDTSPVQWSVIRSLRQDFFSGLGARPVLRTFFAVGDEKQSIYSFQGARPEQFSQEALQTERAVLNGGQTFNTVRLPLSFRSTRSVLGAVDKVFEAPQNRRGLSAAGEAVDHQSSRIGHPGTVEVWEMIAAEKQEKSEDWTAPFDSTPESAPSARLARRIAHRISEMVGREMIIEKGRKRLVQPGDILVLVRKRDGFVNGLTRALKRPYNVPVAGADRLKLTSHIAVQDLLALGRFLLLPADDLSLAALLKSPLFNHSEDELMALAADRQDEQSLFHRLKEISEVPGSPFKVTVAQIEMFIDKSKTLSVHDFYARVLGLHGGRKAYLGRLGSEVSDILDEFLGFALAFETSGLPGLQSFVSTLELEAPEVKREQDKERNEVRIMTVHASKGLEAPIVFLVDGGSKPFNPNHLAKLRLLEGPNGAPIPIWVPSKTQTNSLVQHDTDRRRGQAEEEYRRLLYVGMTRAADQLIIAGYRGVLDTGEIWHRMVSEALGADEVHSTEVEFAGPDGTWNGLRWQFEEPELQLPFDAESTEFQSEHSLPPLWRPLPPPPRLPRPLSPSTAGSLVLDETPEVLTTSRLFTATEKGGIALQKGRLVHRMLQNLPAIPQHERQEAAERYAERAARFWPAAERLRLVETVMSVLESEELSALFSENSEAEVSVMGTIELNREPRAVSGRVDRMAVLADKVIIADYKTNRQSPETAEQAPLSHRVQLAIYRDILKPLYPQKTVECWLIYTESGTTLRLDDATLNRSLADIETS